MSVTRYSLELRLAGSLNDLLKKQGSYRDITRYLESFSITQGLYEIQQMELSLDNRLLDNYTYTNNTPPFSPGGDCDLTTDGKKWIGLWLTPNIETPNVVYTLFIGLLESIRYRYKGYQRKVNINVLGLRSLLKDQAVGAYRYNAYTGIKPIKLTKSLLQIIRGEGIGNQYENGLDGYGNRPKGLFYSLYKASSDSEIRIYTNTDYCNINTLKRAIFINYKPSATKSLLNCMNELCKAVSYRWDIIPYLPTGGNDYRLALEIKDLNTNYVLKYIDSRYIEPTDIRLTNLFNSEAIADGETFLEYPEDKDDGELIYDYIALPERDIRIINISKDESDYGYIEDYLRVTHDNKHKKEGSITVIADYDLSLLDIRDGDRFKIVGNTLDGLLNDEVFINRVIKNFNCRSKPQFRLSIEPDLGKIQYLRKVKASSQTDLGISYDIETGYADEDYQIPIKGLIKVTSGDYRGLIREVYIQSYSLEELIIDSGSLSDIGVSLVFSNYRYLNPPTPDYLYWKYYTRSGSNYFSIFPNSNRNDSEILCEAVIDAVSAEKFYYIYECNNSGITGVISMGSNPILTLGTIGKLEYTDNYRVSWGY